MDLFRVTSDPRDLFLLLSARIQECIARSEKLMKEEVRTAFLQLTDASTVWAFSLLLSGWQLRSHSEVSGSLASYGLAPLYEQLGAVPLLSEFTARAERAASPVDLAGASAYFATAVENVGVSLLRMALGSPQFLRAKEALLTAFPAEATFRKLREPGGNGTTAAAGQSRTRRFDDFGLRAGRRSESPARAPVEHAPRTVQPEPSSATPLPALDPPEFATVETRAAAMEWLGDVGYSPAQIEAILQRRVRFS